MPQPKGSREAPQLSSSPLERGGGNPNPAPLLLSHVGAAAGVGSRTCLKEPIDRAGRTCHVRCECVRPRRRLSAYRRADVGVARKPARMSDLLGRKGGNNGEEEIQPVSGCLGCACCLCGGDRDFGCELGFSGTIRSAVPAKPDAAEGCRRQAHRCNGGLLLLAGGLFHAVFRDGGGESILHVHTRSALCGIRLLEDRRLERQHRNQLEWPVRAAVDHGWPVRLAGDVYVRCELWRSGRDESWQHDGHGHCSRWWRTR